MVTSLSQLLTRVSTFGYEFSTFVHLEQNIWLRVCHIGNNILGYDLFKVTTLSHLVTILAHLVTRFKTHTKYIGGTNKVFDPVRRQVQVDLSLIG